MKTVLKREVSLFSAIVYGVGIILGAGIYALIGEATSLAGNSVWLSFTIAAIVSGFTGLSYMELVSMFPQSAAEYMFVKNAFKNDLLAFNVGWIEVFSDIIATSAVALGFAGYFNALFGTNEMIAALSLITLMSFVNLWGIKESARINVVFSLIEIFGLLLIVILGFSFGCFRCVNYLDMPYGATGTLGASALIFFAYIGFEDLANISEEVKNPKKNVPMALLISILITAVIYVLVGVSVVSLVGWQELATSNAPLALVASTILGDQAFWIISVIALFATANTVLVGLIVGSRMLFGMSRDGSLPEIISRMHPERQTPWIAVLLSMVFSIVFVLIGHIDIVASITDLGTFYIFIFVNASAIALRYRESKLVRVFRTPLNIGRFPLVPFFGLLSSLILVTYLRLDSIIMGLGVALVGGILFLLTKKR